MNKDILDIDNLVLLNSTAKAYLIKNLDDEEIWIPKSQVEYISFGKNITDDRTGHAAQEIICLSIPEWLAEKKGLI